MVNIPIDWNVFEYKFSQNPRQAFESLSYILFCHEFEQDYGIFRYFNQPYIETQPVVAEDGYVTGFQAKYYDAGTSLSSKVSEFKSSIEDAKDKYAGINRIIFYVNKELSSSTNKNTDKPMYQINIEEYGNECGIQVEWRVPSHFEMMLLNDELVILRDLYFNPNPGIYKFIENVQKHKEMILSGIKSTINYLDQEIKISKPIQQLNDFKNSNSKLFVVYGNAGTGKSGLIKDFISQLEETDNGAISLMFSASDIDVEEDILFLKQYGDYQLDDLFLTYKNEPLKICIIDAAEKYSIFKYPDTLRRIINNFIDNDWKVIITIRTIYKDGFCDLFIEDIHYDEYRIDQIEERELTDLSEKYDFVLPKDGKVRSLLCNLFYLRLYLNLDNLSTDIPTNTEAFADRVWQEVIRNETRQIGNLPAKREKFILDMVFNMLQKESYVYQISTSDNYEAVSGLKDSGIIVPYDFSKDLWMMSHDVYEELVINRILSNKYENSISVEKFFEGFGSSLRARKMFRGWLETKLEQYDSDCVDFLMNLLTCDKLEQYWKDEVLIALMSSDNPEAFRTLESFLSQNQYELFSRAVFLLNTACRDVNLRILKLMPDKGVNKYQFTEPVGKAWYTVFLYINNHRSLIPWSVQHITLVTDALRTWTFANNRGKETRLAGLIALFLKGLVWDEGEYKYTQDGDDTYEKINDIILLSAMEIKAELGEVYDEMINKVAFDHNTENYVLLKKSVSNIFECMQVCSALPTKVLQLSKTYWMYQNPEKYYSHSSNTENDFGLNRHIYYEYYPESAFQSPLYWLLRVNPKESLDCILELINYSTECYEKSHLNIDYKECYCIELIFSDMEHHKQICSDRLWKMHRGTSVTPSLLKSILMALEKWLLDVVEESPEIAKEYCLYLLRNADSAAITSVVVSVVIAHPNELFEITCILIKTKEIFLLDIARHSSEAHVNFLKGVSPASYNQRFDHERITSNNKEFRKVKLEDLIIRYQIYMNDLTEKEFNERKEKLYASIDEAIKDIDSWEPQYKFAYYRMDLRKYKKTEPIAANDGNHYIALQTDMPKELVELSNKHQEKANQLFKHSELSVWAYNRYIKDEKGYTKYCRYEDNPVAAFNEAKQILNEEDVGNGFDNVADAIYACVALLRDFKNSLTKKQIDFCREVVLSAGYNIVNSNAGYKIIDNTAPMISELAKMASSNNTDANWSNPLFLLLAIVMNYDQERANAAKCISEILWTKDKAAAMKIVYTYIQIIPEYINLVERYDGMSLIEFFGKYSEEIEEAFNKDIDTLELIDSRALNLNSLMILHTMLNSKDLSICEFVLNTGYRIWANIFNETNRDTEIQRDYHLECEYTDWLADYVLNLTQEHQSKFLHTLMPLVKFDRKFGRWIWNIIAAEDVNPRYNAFWNLWNLLQDYIFTKYDENIEYYTKPASRISRRYEFDEVLVNYLLAGANWKGGVKSWHTLKEENAIFYSIVANRLGYNAITLYSIARVLNSVGTDVFANHGVNWLSTIVRNNMHLRERPLTINTLYYIEEYIYSYIRREQLNFRSDNIMKRKVLDILNFLVDRGSTVGFLLREEII